MNTTHRIPTACPVLVVLLTLVALLVLGAAPAGAFIGYPSAPNAVFGAPGAGAGQFSGPAGVAVEESTGDVYVVDAGDARVEKFDAEGKFLTQFSGAETPAGSFSGPRSVAVDNSSAPTKGDVYVTDVGHGVIDVFGASGKYLSQITGMPSFAGELYGVAVDTSGNVWAYDANGDVDQFTPAGALLSQFNIGRGTTPGFALDTSGDIYLLFGCGCVGKYTPTGTQLAEWGRGGAALTVDGTTNDVFLDQSISIERSGPFGEPYGVPLETFGTGAIASSHGIAVNGKTHTVYVSESEASEVAIFPFGLLPDVSTGSASGGTPSSATLEGVVNPDGQEVTSCRFEYGTSTAYEHTAPCTPAPGAGSSPVAVSAAVAGLEPNTTYHFRLAAGNTLGVIHGAGETFTTQAAAPALAPASAGAITRVSATVSGGVNPQKSPTTYCILYGETSEYGEHSETFQAGEGLGETVVHVGLQGLAPSTTYHYAVQATNQAGTVTTPDATFTTAPQTPPTAVTGGASNVALTTATVAGTIGPEGLETSYVLEFGTGSEYGTSIDGEAGAGTEPIAIEVGLQYLAPGTTYHYRIVAVNSDGRAYGADQTFTTPAYSAPIVQPFTLPLIATPSIAFPTETEATQQRAAKKKAAKRRHGKGKGRKRGRR